MIDLSRLHPELTRRWSKISQAAAILGHPILPVQGWRSWKDQNELFAQGRTREGKIVTRAQGGESWHNYGKALDFAFMDSQLKPDWGEDRPWEMIGEMAEATGLRWGGRWKVPDRPHLDWVTAGETLAALKAEAMRGGRQPE